MIVLTGVFACSYYDAYCLLFNIMGKFPEIPPDTKLPENLQA